MYSQDNIILTPEEIQEFKEITFRLYKRMLSDDEAKDQLSRMVIAFELIQDKDDIDNTIAIKKKGDKNEN